ncbi:glycosyltransferase [Stenotrophomonas sp. NPDC078853]|uniref:glycosyltransferase n=1 Tax=Stenotrophomonas sp. NPDC078853 TaxID=3364534 RepID=UPI00384BD6DC
MKVALVVNRFPVLSESFIVRLAQSLDQDGIGLSVYALNGFDEPLLQRLSPYLWDRVRSGDVAVHYPAGSHRGGRLRIISLILHAIFSLFLSPLYSLEMAWRGLRFRSIIGALTYHRLSHGNSHDVVHAQFLTMAVPVVAAHRILGTNPCVTIVSYVRGYDVTKIGAVASGELTMIKNANRLDGICSVSKSLAARLADLGLGDIPSEIIYSGIPVTALRYSGDRATLGSAVTFVQVGRMVEKKGHDLSLKMLAALDDSSTLSFVGDGPLRAELELLAGTLGLSHRVTFHGSKTHQESIDIISASTFMLAPSRTAADGDSEGIPNVVKEAMALGVVCIGSDHSGIPEIISDEVTGFLFKENDVQSFLSTVRKAMADSDALGRIAISSRELVEREFDSDKTSSRLRDFYRRAISR